MTVRPEPQIVEVEGMILVEREWLRWALERLEGHEDQVAGRVCPRCDGHGEIEVNPADLDPLRRRDPQEDDIVRCPRCSGTGDR